MNQEQLKEIIKTSTEHFNQNPRDKLQNTRLFNFLMDTFTRYTDINEQATTRELLNLNNVLINASEINEENLDKLVSLIHNRYSEFEINEKYTVQDKLIQFCWKYPITSKLYCEAYEKISVDEDLDNIEKNRLLDKFSVLEEKFKELLGTEKEKEVNYFVNLYSLYATDRLFPCELSSVFDFDRLAKMGKKEDYSEVIYAFIKNQKPIVFKLDGSFNEYSLDDFQKAIKTAFENNVKIDFDISQAKFDSLFPEFEFVRIIYTLNDELDGLPENLVFNATGFIDNYKISDIAGFTRSLDYYIENNGKVGIYKDIANRFDVEIDKYKKARRQAVTTKRFI